MVRTLKAPLLQSKVSTLIKNPPGSRGLVEHRVNSMTIEAGRICPLQDVTQHEQQSLLSIDTAKPCPSIAVYAEDYC